MVERKNLLYLSFPILHVLEDEMLRHHSPDYVVYDDWRMRLANTFTREEINRFYLDGTGKNGQIADLFIKLYLMKNQAVFPITSTEEELTLFGYVLFKAEIANIIAVALSLGPFQDDQRTAGIKKFISSMYQDKRDQVEGKHEIASFADYMIACAMQSFVLGSTDAKKNGFSIDSADVRRTNKVGTAVNIIDYLELRNSILTMYFPEKRGLLNPNLQHSAILV